MQLTQIVMVHKHKEYKLPPPPPNGNSWGMYAFAQTMEKQTSSAVLIIDTV
jgi:hypothetical protein